VAATAARAETGCTRPRRKTRHDGQCRPRGAESRQRDSQGSCHQQRAHGPGNRRRSRRCRRESAAARSRRGRYLTGPTPAPWHNSRRARQSTKPRSIPLTDRSWLGRSRAGATAVTAVLAPAESGTEAALAALREAVAAEAMAAAMAAMTAVAAAMVVAGKLVGKAAATVVAESAR